MRISDWSSDVCYSDLSSMAPIETVPLPAKSTIVFAPGGKHVMLFGVNPSVKPGATIPLTLTFTGFPRIEVDAVVVAAGDPAPFASSEERRGGKEGVSTFRSRWSP